MFGDFVHCEKINAHWERNWATNSQQHFGPDLFDLQFDTTWHLLENEQSEVQDRDNDQQEDHVDD